MTMRHSLRIAIAAIGASWTVTIAGAQARPQGRTHKLEASPATVA